MNKYVLFVTSILIGILYSWVGPFLGWLSAIVFMGADSGIFFILIPLLFCFLTGRYYIKKGYRYLPVVGLIIGFIAGFLLLGLGLGLGGT